ncbi:hypothetical protein VMUT_2089 [Vulcanisaeta moutnovskia 768-28]|uniref:AAA domain-containing protein n=1 Tax=Vulcanisaeta moutnovskia (strain 768-28) TaxID=985053 RepID=F0QWR9_VULM7|nr:AAA family ATPase [Vulcanisaeta moutnovskia]ADY02286.1 hypothetical protein VMUT_2089 [Vulcanisaeta moutnovskia 768-28]
MSIKCIASGQKGGVGKSTLTILTAKAAPALGIRLAIIDLAMGNPSTSLNLLGNIPRHTLATYVINVSKVNEVIHVIPTEHGPVYLIPSGYGDLALINEYGDFKERLGSLIKYLIDRVGIDHVVIDFPSFEPSLDSVLNEALDECDIVYPVGIQDLGSVVALRNLLHFVRRFSINVGRPVINMFRESLGRQWVAVVGKLSGLEPSIIHYDPWVIRWVHDGAGQYGVGVKEALSYVIREILS